MDNEAQTVQGSRPVLVWDLPTRLFHWLLVTFVVSSFATGKIGGNWMLYHEWCGEVILALLIFRVVWGFIGSAPSRFRTFLAGPTTVVTAAVLLAVTGSNSGVPTVAVAVILPSAVGITAIVAVADAPSARLGKSQKMTLPKAL